MKKDESLRGASRFVENYFGIFGDQGVEVAYLNYLRDIELYSRTNRSIRNNTTYLCSLFSAVTNSPIEELVRIEQKYCKSPIIIPFKKESQEHNLKFKLDEDFDERYIYKYTASDAHREGLFVEVGKCSTLPVYFTKSLIDEYLRGKALDLEAVEQVMMKGFELVSGGEADDTEYLLLRVVERGKIWVALTKKGMIFMRPEDY